MSSEHLRQVALTWEGGQRFRGGPDGGTQILVDGDSADGLAPMQLLLTSIAGCMAIDVVFILEKSRVAIEHLEMDATGVRAPEAPKRYTSVELVYRISGPEESQMSKVERAVALSRDKYCSVLHTLDPALDFTARVERI